MHDAVRLNDINNKEMEEEENDTRRARGRDFWKR